MTTLETRAPAVARIELLVDQRWFPVCDAADLITGRGVAALLPDGRQVALFRDRAGEVHAVDNRDPFCGAYVLSRGLLGSAAGRVFVSSPMLKHRFDLRSGECLDDPAVRIAVYTTRVSEERVGETV
ncbi:nitrite reductase small subunit NirD [Streptomyces capparidis]